MPGMLGALRRVAQCFYFSLRWGLTISLSFLLLYSFPERVQSDEIFGPEGYIDLAGLWSPPFVISVCWEPTQNSFDQEKRWAQDEVKTLIVNNSSVRFKDWQTCAPTAMGIRIRIADEWPVSDVGRQWVRDSKNPLVILQDRATGRPLELPTHVVLNFSFKKQFQQCLSSAELGKEHCIRAIAVHEMLHALGFLHEQLRPDAPEDCKKKYKKMSDSLGISPLEATIQYDADSHMNYCANMYRKPIRLSAGDIRVLTKFYTTQ